MINILVIWIVFLAGFAIGLFLGGKAVVDLRRKLAEKCTICFADKEFINAAAAAFEMSDENK